MRPTSIAELSEAVFLKRPVLKELLKEAGDISTFEYAKHYTHTEQYVPDELKAECIKEIYTHTEEIFGEEIARSVKKQLRQNYAVSTNDHAGPMTHPFFLNGNLLAMISIASEHLVQENVIVLAFHNVSLGNSSFPRGILFHTRANEHMARIPLFPARQRAAPVYGLGAYTKKEAEHGFDSCLLANNIDKNSQEALRLRTAFEAIYLTPEVLREKTFSNQIGLTNLALGKSLFSSAKPMLPRLIYLNEEAIVLRLLLAHLERSTLLTHILLESSLQEKIETLFDGIPGGFTRSQHQGTFLFWYLPHGSTHRVALWRKGAQLVSRDGSVVIEITPSSLKKHIELNELLPSTMLSMITLSCYYGLTCFGGFSQVNYLTWITEAYRKLGAVGPHYTAPTKLLCGDFIAASLSLESGEQVAATGFDFILYNDRDSMDQFIACAKKLPIKDAVGLMMPEFYRILYPHEQKLLPTFDQAVHELALFGIVQPSLHAKRAD